MKRNNPQKDIITYSIVAAGSSSITDDAAGLQSFSSDVTGKGKNPWEEVEDQDAGGDDELLAVLGYKVKPSDLDDIAQKIEHLVGVFGNDDGLSLIASDSVHYNPSDISSLLESMISELNPTTEQEPPMTNDPFLNTNTTIAGSTPPSSAVDSSSGFTDDLQAIPGNAIFPPAKKLKPSSSSPSSSYNPIQNSNRVLLVYSQENGIRLVHTLMASAEAVQQENLTLAESLVKQAGMLAVSQSGAMKKVATYFAEALARRIFRLSPQ